MSEAPENIRYYEYVVGLTDDSLLCEEILGAPIIGNFDEVFDGFMRIERDGEEVFRVINSEVRFVFRIKVVQQDAGTE